MFKNMKLGAKIGVGFFIMMAIAVLLGAVAVYNMKNVQGQSNLMSTGYVPEVEISAGLVESSLLTMYGMRGYGFTEEEKFYEDAQKSLGDVEAELEKVEQLIKDADFLVKLKEDYPEVKSSVAEYKKLAEETKKVNEKLVEDRKKMDEGAGEYMKGCNTFLAGQNKKMEAEIRSGASVAKMNERLDKITLINDILDLGNATRVGNFKSQATRDPEIFREALKNFPKIEEKITAIRKITYDADDNKLLDEVEAGATEYKTAMNDFLENWLHREELGVERNVAAEKVLEGTGAVSAAGINAMTTKMADSVKTISMASNVMVVGLVIAVILGVIIAMFITRSITLPVNRIITDLSDGAEQVTSASGQVASASQSLAEGAAEQASSIEEISSSLEEMSSMTRQNADNADQANSLAKVSRESANKGNEATSRMIDAMTRMNASATETQKIIKTIDEIAFQTNLLALNAAVEAARAGEAGKGFAVVAEEVRNLAQRAGEAARNTAQLIEESVVNTQSSGKIANEMADALKEITDGASKVSELVAEIAAASKEQAQGIDQVNIAVGQMDKVTQQNSSNAEESASAAEELSSQADSMSGVVGELMALVGGAAQGQPVSVKKTTRAAATTPKHHYDFSHAKTGGAAKKIGNGGVKQKAVKVSSGEVESIIPFHDGDDFNDF